MSEVLLVDDDPLIREAVADALGAAGLKVGQAADAEAALAADRIGTGAEPPPAVLVTDVNLGPGMDGLALAEAARRRLPGLGIVYITGRPSNLDGHALGARERFLPKPFAPETVVRAVRSLLAAPHPAP